MDTMTSGQLQEVSFNKGLQQAISLTKNHRAIMEAIPGTKMILDTLDVLLYQFEASKLELTGRKKTIRQVQMEAGEHLLDEGFNKELTEERDPDLYAPSIHDEEPPEMDYPPGPHEFDEPEIMHRVMGICSGCGKGTHELSEDSYCHQCVADMQDNGIHTNP